MNESANRYFIKNTKDGNFVDITTLFDGVGVLKLEGMLNKGKPVNVYSEQWVNTQDEDFMITSSQEGVTKIIHENQDISLTFIVRQTYAENQIDVQTVHDDFVAYLTGSDIWIRSNYVGGKMVHCVCLESYEPTTVSLQRGLKSYIMGTIKLHSLGGAFDYFISGNLVRVALASQVDGLVRGKPFTNYLVYSENNGLVSVTILMGGTDITSTAYNHATKEINIPQVLGNVVINAESSPKIVFADQNVKSLCVTNWGGNYLQNEITEYEATQVTDLGDVFKSNTQITSFNELQLFTGLQTVSGGIFQGCTALQSIMFPSINITTGMFTNLLRDCTSLVKADLSPIKADSYQVYYTFGTSSTTNAMTEVTLPGGYYTNAAGGNGGRATFRNCKNLTTLRIDGVADFSGITAFHSSNNANAMFLNCTSLTTIIGTITGISADLYMAACPLTADSAMVILNGLADLTGKTSKTLTLSATTKTALTNAGIDYDAIAAAKNWTIE